MRYLGPYVRPSDNRKFMVIVRDDGSKSTITYARYLMLGKVKEHEVVDHIDENRTNDSIDNLQPLTRGENAAKTNKHLARGRRTITRWCGHCGKEFQWAPRKDNQGLVFCSKRCNGKVNH